MINEKTFSEAYGIKFSVHSGKMQGIRSLNTSVVLNAICQARAKIAGSICSKCYAKSLVAFRKSLRKVLEKNTRVLTSIVIPVKYWPVINDRVFRFESFGDLNNSIQVINYFNFCLKNPETLFALWTKNPEFIAAAIADGHAKPENLIIIQSSKHINVVDEPRYDFIDGVFTVYDAEYIEKHDIAINCGARHCLSCMRCYTKHEGVFYINEKLK